MSADKENIQFVKFIERYPCLYDHTCKSYSNRIETDRAWQAVAEEFQITMRRCKEKWKNIRTVFRRHHFAKPGAEGSSKKEYYMSDALQYLAPFLQVYPKQLSGSLTNLTHNEEEQDVGERYSVPYEVSDVEDDHDPAELLEISSGNPRSYVGSSRSSSEGYVTKQQLGKRKANSSLEDDLLNYFKSKLKPGENETTNGVEDPEAQSDEHFLLSLKKDMTEMNSRQKRIFKRKIFELIDEVLDS